MGKNGRILFDRPKPTVGCSASGRRINKLLTLYNSSVHSTIGTSPSKINPSNVYSVLQKANSLRAKTPQGRVTFKVGDLVRITKERSEFAKGYEQIFLTEILRIVKVI
jgi:hypothetical protein